MQFNVGDVVRLKSGGLTMTVEEVAETYVACCWFDEKGQIARNTFSAAMLEHAR